MTLPKVLIVPLWNWNRVLYVDTEQEKGLNRTFMELKQAIRAAATTGTLS